MCVGTIVDNTKEYQEIFVVLRSSGKSPKGEIIWERIGLCLHDITQQHLTAHRSLEIQLADRFEVYCIG